MESLSTTSFRRNLYAEHHDELAFLYGQLCRLQTDDSVPRTALVDLERRLVAHLDALQIGAELAVGEVRRRTDVLDPGHVYAATLLTCALHDREALHGLMQFVEGTGSGETTAEGETLAEQLEVTPAAALADALRHAAPVAWASLWPTWIAASREPLRGWLADAASFSPSDGASEGIAAAFQSELKPSPRLILAAGRLGSDALVSKLAALFRSAVEQDSAAVGAAALRAWAMVDRPGALACARSARDRGALTHRLFGSAGELDDASMLVRRLESGSIDAVLALGLLGELSTVRPLVAVLAEPLLVVAAAKALVWITGAETDTVMSDSASAIPGTAPIDDTNDPEQWRDWLRRAASTFYAGTAYRFGKPKTPQAVADAWLDHHASALYHRWAAEEMRLRFGAPISMDLRASQGRQQQQARSLVAWSRSASSGASLTRV